MRVRLLVGAVLGSLLYAACGAAPEEGAPVEAVEAAEAIGSAPSAVTGASRLVMAWR